MRVVYEGPEAVVDAEGVTYAPGVPVSVDADKGKSLIRRPDFKEDRGSKAAANTDDTGKGDAN